MKFLSAFIFFVSEGQICQPLTVIIGQVMAEINLSLLFRNELYNCNWDAVMPVEGKRMLGIFDENSSLCLA
jgi:hypothetical protein